MIGPSLEKCTSDGHRSMLPNGPCTENRPTKPHCRCQTRLRQPSLSSSPTCRDCPSPSLPPCRTSIWSNASAPSARNNGTRCKGCCGELGTRVAARSFEERCHSTLSFLLNNSLFGFLLTIELIPIYPLARNILWYHGASRETTRSLPTCYNKWGVIF